MQASCRILQYTLRCLANQEDTLHVVCVQLQNESRSADRRQAQDKIRKQYGSLLKGRLHRLHIVRVLHTGSDGASPYIARAICAKASMLEADVIVVGGRPRTSATGMACSSAVAEAVRKHSRRPVLLISPDHPILARTLPSIQEEPCHVDSAPKSTSSYLLLTADSLTAETPEVPYIEQDVPFSRTGTSMAVSAC